MEGELSRVNAVDWVANLSEAVGVEHLIEMAESPPVQNYPYQIAPGRKDEMHREVKQLLEMGIITPSRSPWSAPMVPFRKTDGSLHLCIDYRKLNAVTVGDPYQMPRVEDLLDQVAEARWLSKLYLRKGFYQIPMEESGRKKTVFLTPWGKYEFRRMPFGLRNAPATFAWSTGGVGGIQ